MSTQSFSNELVGLGLGLRAPHYQDILQTQVRDGAQPLWFEALTDNYMGAGGLPLHYLGQIAERYALSFHGVGLSLGSTDPLDEDYLARLKQLVGRFRPAHVSDHLCWSSASGIHGHDLFPMPYTESAVRHISDRIKRVQDALGQRILIENVSSYLLYEESYLSEVEFLCEVLERADCYLLCDINNIYVSAKNHGFDAQAYLNKLPEHRVKEVHLAGFEDQGSHLLDTHGARVHDDVWALYRGALTQFGKVPALIEWDTNIPSYAVLLEELNKAQVLWDEMFCARDRTESGKDSVRGAEHVA